MNRSLSTLGLVAALAIAAGTTAAAGCNGNRGTSVRPDPVRPTVTTTAFRLYYLVDLDGYLEPCGCNSRPLGGIDRLARFLESERPNAQHSLFVAAGDLLYRDPRLDQRMEYQEARKAESLVRILDQLQLVAYAPGPSDFARGLDEWRRIVGTGRAQPLAANARNNETLHSVVLRTVNGINVGIVGVSDFREADEAPLPPGAPETTDPAAAARTAVAAARQQGARVVIVLASVARRQAVALARSVPGIDFVIAAREEAPNPPPPQRIGNAYVLTATNQGKGVGVVDITLRGNEGTLADASETTANAARTSIDRRIAELRERITTTEREPNADRAAIELLRQRVAQLERERGAIRAAVPAEGSYFQARVQEINPDLPRRPDIEQTIASYFRAVNEHNRTTFASLRAPTPRPGERHFVGDESCRDCHEEAFDIWIRTPHSSAYHTLEVASKNYNLSCVSCHVTGYQQAGGAEVVQNEGRRDVQCESCHGPGSDHLRARNAVQLRATIRRQVPGDFCARECHTPEHSDHFDYNTYLPRILGPGHGYPVGGTGGRVRLTDPVLQGGQGGAHPVHSGVFPTSADGGAADASASRDR